MGKYVRIALAALFLSCIALSPRASSQNIPAVDLFGGYSYLRFDFPANSVTAFSSQRVALHGWEFSGAVGLLRHLSAEADFSGHHRTNCGDSPFDCDNFSYLFGPRYNFGARTARTTGFVHGLFGQDRMDFPLSSGVSIRDASVAAGVGGGLDIWAFRHLGLQLGPADFLYTHHLNNVDVPTQYSYRVSAGIAFRFGGPEKEPEPQPKAKPVPAKCKAHRSLIRPWHKSKPPDCEGQPAEGQPSEAQPAPASASKPKTHRSWIRPWHKTTVPAETQPSETQPAPAPAPRTAQPSASAAPSAPRGLSIRPLGIVVGPQEFDGAKVLHIEPGSVAEMASLKVGDLIKAVDDKVVRTPMELAAELSDKVGKVRISIQRGDFATETTILLGGR
jgi:hypothetical protein